MTNFVIYKLYRKYIGRYPTPVNISYFWNFGSLAGLILIVQIVSGIILAMHYSPSTITSFMNLEYIMRELNYGWLLRYLHANGASMFFLIVYLHILRGIYYGSYLYPRKKVWVSGVILYVLLVATAFLGYVLPWGQMSYWAATVITNLFSAIPVVGSELVQWLWGGYSIGNPTLNRFYSLHYLLPFIILALSVFHLILLNFSHSNNPLGIKSSYDYIPFSPYFIIKDLVGAIILFILYFYFLFFNSNYLGHSINYVEANPLVTPEHIVPEWYYLLIYGMLRSIPDKLGGVLVLAFSILILILLPLISKSLIRSIRFKKLKLIFWIFVFNNVLLSWIGSQPIEYPYLIIGQVCTMLYFILVCQLFYNYNINYFKIKKLY